MVNLNEEWEKIDLQRTDLIVRLTHASLRFTQMIILFHINIYINFCFPISCNCLTRQVNTLTAIVIVIYAP